MNAERKLIVLFAGFSGGFFALADDEASNTLYVRSAAHGAYYAKCVPSDLYGTNGRTQIYIATETNDVLQTTFDWYSPNLYLQGTAWGISVVRFGGHLRGRAASSNDLAIAFYMNDKLLKSYSTLDIAGSATNVDWSVSHYAVFTRIDGYRWLGTNDYGFDVKGRAGKQLTFDVRTGEILK